MFQLNKLTSTKQFVILQEAFNEMVRDSQIVLDFERHKPSLHHLQNPSLPGFHYATFSIQLFIKIHPDEITSLSLIFADTDYFLDSNHSLYDLLCSESKWMVMNLLVDNRDVI